MNLKSLLDEYQKSHHSLVNKRIHLICVPLIEWSLLGLLWELPHPEFFGSLNWSMLLTVLAFGHYVQFKNFKVLFYSLILMSPFWIYISFHPPFVWQTSLIVFTVAWIGQFYGHKVEGKKPSFFKDLFFLLIGPLWVIEFILRSRKSSLVSAKYPRE